jgi:hypothetical protein
MKKLIFFSVFLLLSPLFFSFTHPVKPKKNKEKCWSCAQPTNLSATKSGGIITLSWNGPTGASFTPGGYYNCVCTPTSTRPFGSSAGTSHTQVISVDPSTYSITYQVTATCTDGTTSTSAPFSKNF